MLDKFHWHECLHMADALNRMIEDNLINHSTYTHLDNDIIGLLSQVQENLNKYYVYCCEKQDELDD